MPIQVVARSTAWVYGHSLAGIVGLNRTRDMDVISYECCVCCQAEASAMGQILVWRSV